MTASVEAGAAANSVKARFPDGEYAFVLRASHTLVVTPPSGGSLSWVRCG